MTELRDLDSTEAPGALGAPGLGHVGISLPQTGERGDAADSASALASYAEQLGYGTLWVSELTTAPMLDPLLVLAHCAAVTDTVRLGLAVVIAPLRPPFRLANELATIDRLSKGRLVVGLGYGSKPEIYPRFGLSADHRLTRYVEGVGLLRRLWLSTEVSYAGPWTLDGPTNVVRPSQPCPPIFIGARREPAIRRATQLGDGWIVSGSAPFEEFVAGLAVLRDELERQGRDPATFPVAKRVYVAVSRNETRDRERVRGWFAATYGNAALADAAVVGSADLVGSHLADLHERGVHHVILNPVFDETEQADQLADITRIQPRPTSTPNPSYETRSTMETT